MASFTNLSKNTTTFTGDTKTSGASSTVIGSPMGLLLALTYASSAAISSIFSNSSKSTSNFSNTVKS